MNRLFINVVPLPFWVSPNSSVYQMMLRSEDRSAIRRARSMESIVPKEDPLQDPPIRPVRPLPTDVPAPEPRDVPLREPMDVPPPDSGKPIKPIPKPDPKPRPTP
jgi:hypothetical protein